MLPLMFGYFKHILSMKGKYYEKNYLTPRKRNKIIRYSIGQMQILPKQITKQIPR